MLDVGDGQSIYWEVSGNPMASRRSRCMVGRAAAAAQAGDAGSIRIAIGSSSSTSAAAAGARPMPATWRPTWPEHDPPPHRRLERLREHLGIERWLVWGGSWGVTLALAYAERHPERVSEMVLLSVTMTRRSDVHWLGHEVGRYFPEEWARFRAGVPEADRDGDLIAAYDRLLNASVIPPSGSRRRATGSPGRTRSCRSRRATSRPTRAGPTSRTWSPSPAS